MARTKQTARMSTGGPARAMVPPPKKGSIEWQLAEAQRIAAAKEAKLTQELHALRKSIDEDRKIQQAKFELAMQERIKLIEETMARESARAADVVTPMSDAASSESQSSSSSAAASSSSSSAAAASVSPASSTADQPISRIHDLTLPPHWPAAQSHHVTLETLSTDHPDFKMVERMMQTTGMPNAGVLQVQRIYNRPLWDRYVQARARIMNKIGNESLNNPESMGNEKLMFHGSRHNQPSLIYANADGFDVRMAGHGMLGAGIYFSDTAGYSGVSYAHPLTPQTWGPTAGKKYTAVIPPLLQTHADGTVKAGKIPKNAYQMFLARVCLGTGFDPSKQGGRPHQGYTSRAPLRPFFCSCCEKEVDLEALNVALLRASVMRTPEKATGGATLEEFDEDDGLADAAPAAGSANGKRKRGGSAKATKKVKTNVAAAAAAATTVGVAPVPAAGAAPSPVVASAPVVLAPQAAPIVLRKSARHAVAGAPVAVFTPPRKKIRARRNAPAVVVAPPTPLQLAPVQQPQQPQQQQQQPQLLVPVVQQLLPTPAVMPPALVTAAAPVAPSAPVVPVAAAAAASADDGTITMTDAPELEAPAAAVAEEPSPVVSASPAAPAAPAPLSFDATPVCCPNPKCGQVMGTRGSLLAHPYRYDSVISGHMSVTYESAASYPELLITYTASR